MDYGRQYFTDLMGLVKSSTVPAGVEKAISGITSGTRLARLFASSDALWDEKEESESRTDFTIPSTPCSIHYTPRLYNTSSPFLHRNDYTRIYHNDTIN